MNNLYELEFEAPRGTRLHRYFLGVTISAEEHLWWCHRNRIWLTLDEARKISTEGFSSHAPCRTLRAFQRHLRKHGPLLREHGSCIVRLPNRFLGHGVICRL